MLARLHDLVLGVEQRDQGLDGLARRGVQRHHRPQDGLGVAPQRGRARGVVGQRARDLGFVGVHVVDVLAGGVRAVVDGDPRHVLEEVLDLGQRRLTRLGSEFGRTAEGPLTGRPAEDLIGDPDRGCRALVVPGAAEVRHGAGGREALQRQGVLGADLLRGPLQEGGVGLVHLVEGRPQRRHHGVVDVGVGERLGLRLGERGVLGAEALEVVPEVALAGQGLVERLGGVEVVRPSLGESLLGQGKLILDYGDGPAADRADGGVGRLPVRHGRAAQGVHVPAASEHVLLGGLQEVPGSRHAVLRYGDVGLGSALALGLGHALHGGEVHLEVADHRGAGRLRCAGRCELQAEGLDVGQALGLLVGRKGAVGRDVVSGLAGGLGCLASVGLEGVLGGVVGSLARGGRRFPGGLVSLLGVVHLLLGLGGGLSPIPGDIPCLGGPLGILWRGAPLDSRPVLLLHGLEASHSGVLLPLVPALGKGLGLLVLVLRLSGHLSSGASRSLCGGCLILELPGHSTGVVRELPLFGCSRVPRGLGLAVRLGFSRGAGRGVRVTRGVDGLLCLLRGLGCHGLGLRLDVRRQLPGLVGGLLGGLAPGEVLPAVLQEGVEGLLGPIDRLEGGLLRFQTGSQHRPRQRGEHHVGALGQGVLDLLDLLHHVEGRVRGDPRRHALLEHLRLDLGLLDRRLLHAGVDGAAGGGLDADAHQPPGDGLLHRVPRAAHRGPEARARHGRPQDAPPSPDGARGHREDVQVREGDAQRRDHVVARRALGDEVRHGVRADRPGHRLDHLGADEQRRSQPSQVEVVA